MTSSRALGLAELAILESLHWEQRIAEKALSPEGRRAREHLLDFAQWTLPSYQRAWHLARLADELEAIERGENDRLMVFMPPRHGKSELVSIRYPAWYLCRNPDRMFITASYGDTLARNFGRRARNVLALDRTREIFPGTALSQDSKSANLWHTMQDGQLLAVGVGGGITGQGAHVLNIDDPVKNREEAESETARENTWDWYTAEARTRLEPGGAIVLTMTRWHEDDLAGRLLEREGDRWRVLRFPAFNEDNEALWPDRYGQAELRSIHDEVGTRDWTALYMQAPAPDEGAIFKWWPTYKAVPQLKSIIMPIDTAYTDKATADYTAWTVWGYDGAKAYVMDAGRYQGEAPEAEKAVGRAYRELVAGYPRVRVLPLIRKKVAIDRVLGQHLRQAGLPVGEVDLPSGNTKEEMGKIVSAEFEGGRALIPHGQADWLRDWLMEHKGFPNAKHDDWVETTIVALWHLFRSLPYKRPSGRVELYA